VAFDYVLVYACIDLFFYYRVFFEVALIPTASLEKLEGFLKQAEGEFM